MRPELKQKIEDYLNSLSEGQHNTAQLNHLLFVANSLLRDALSDADNLEHEVRDWQTKAFAEDIYGNLCYTDGELVDKAITIFRTIIPNERECR